MLPARGGRRSSPVRLPTLAAAATTVVAVAITASACGATPIAPVTRRAATVDDPGAKDPSLLQVDNPTDLRGQASVTVEADDNVFTPKEIKVSPGTKVTWTNKGFNQHNVTPVTDGQFAPIPTGELNPQASADRTFATKGVYRYYCTIHGGPTKGQRALIVVDDQ
jgi:plastocyanin